MKKHVLWSVGSVVCLGLSVSAWAAGDHAGAVETNRPVADSQKIRPEMTLGEHHNVLTWKSFEKEGLLKSGTATELTGELLCEVDRPGTIGPFDKCIFTVGKKRVIASYPQTMLLFGEVKQKFPSLVFRQQDRTLGFPQDGKYTFVTDFKLTTDGSTPGTKIIVYGPKS